jgi:hypothetical protein
MSKEPGVCESAEVVSMADGSKIKDWVTPDPTALFAEVFHNEAYEAQ